MWLTITFLFITVHSDLSECDASHSIPIVDLRPFLLGNSTEQQQVIDQVTRALEGIGLVIFKNHGIPQTVIDNAFKMHREFFAESLEYKLKFRKQFNSDGTFEEFYGFTQIGEERLYGKYPDYKETFDATLDVLLKHYNSKLNDFPFPIQEYTEWALALRQRILTMSQLLSMALGKNRFYLSNIFDDNNQNGVLRVAHYPPTSDKNGNDTFNGWKALGRHTDYYPIVIGFQSSNSIVPNQGFEAWDKLNKQWLKVPYIPNAMLMNIGDAMQIWSNNRFTANFHRMKSVDHDRYSMYLFFGPKWSQIVDAKDFVNDNETEIHYEPKTMYDIVRTRMEKIQETGSDQRDDQKLGDVNAIQTD
eukprot:373902_1